MKTRDEYLKGLADQLAHELLPTVTVKQFTENPNLLGGYAEAAIRRLIRRVVYPMQVSSGAVLDFPLPQSLKQRDVIIWAPFPAPAIFEVEGFALVPRSSAFGVLEIKRSNHGSAVPDLEQFLGEGILSVTAARGAAFREDPRKAILGVIAVLETDPSARLQKLIDERSVVAVLKKEADSITVRPNDVFTLVNTLHFISWRYRVQSSAPGFPELVPIAAEPTEP